MNILRATAPAAIESLLADFEPDFDFDPPLPLPRRGVRGTAAPHPPRGRVAGHDALVVHTDMVGWFHTSNAYLRYICDWMREGVLIIPTDSDKAMVLLSFFTQSVILPPGGEPVRRRADLADRRDRPRICRPSRLVHRPRPPKR